MLHWYDGKDSSQVRKAPLILLPVLLERSNATDKFHLRYNDEEIGPNLSLYEKLRVEYHVALPPMPEIEDMDINRYLHEIAHALGSQETWSVHANDIALGFFSFSKLLMFKDLDPIMWPEDSKPTNHLILQALLGDGFHEPASAYSDDAFLDKKKQSVALHPVLDADSSQTLVGSVVLLKGIASRRSTSVERSSGVGA
jgi:hypothetical protein